ncbi:MAG: polysaccharide deacetylase family protein [Dissulfurispiraceae bacterium]
MKANLFMLTVFLFLILLSSSVNAAYKGNDNSIQVQVPILLYHRFGPIVADSMTVTTKVFESQLQYLISSGYVVIPLRQLVDYYLRKGPPPPPKAVVITADDGHKSVYTDMFPLIKKYRIPVTLFLYPSAISNASYAMTWDQLSEMKATGLVDFQSHTYWHPNFKKEKRKLTPGGYEEFVDIQLTKAKNKLQKELGLKVDMLAWPFGIYDDELIRRATAIGYIAAFTLERHHTTVSDNIMALPRYLMTDSDRGKTFERIIERRPPQKGH